MRRVKAMSVTAMKHRSAIIRPAAIRPRIIRRLRGRGFSFTEVLFAVMVLATVVAVYFIFTW